MIFDYIYYIKYNAMKKIIVIITSLFVLASCSATKEAQTGSAVTKGEKKLANQEKVRKIVDKAYFNYGGFAELLPRANYIIIDGDKAIISTAYVGRQYDIRPIVGISMRGITSDYEVTSNLKKGIYEIKMKVKNEKNTFDVYLSIGKNGECSASVTNLYIDFIRYRGSISPIKDKVMPLQDTPAISS
jgi:hypothetical protein